MKAITFVLSLLLTPALCLNAMAQAPLGVLDGILPIDSLMQGRVVRPVFDQELLPLLRQVEEKFAALPDDKKQAMLEKRNPERALDYSPELWDSKADYDTYIETWNKTQLQEQQNVAIGFEFAGGENGVYKVISATIDQNGKTLPLTIGALKYNAKDNTWISNNGILKPEEYVADNKYVYGEQSGYVWMLDKKDALSRQVESVKIAKSSDSKYVFVYYAFVEVLMSSGQPIAQGGYVLRFPIPGAVNAEVGRPAQK